jgi:hypothetical protein
MPLCPATAIISSSIRYDEIAKCDPRPDKAALTQSTRAILSDEREATVLSEVDRPHRELP